MRLLIAAVTVLAANLLGTEAYAQQPTTPYVVPEEIQKIAIELRVAERMGIKWGELADTGRYISVLSAAAVLSREIAVRNKREAPTREDYVAGLVAICLWPPNKPPIVRGNWPAVYPAFYDEKVRVALQGALGSAAVGLPSRLEKTGGIKASYKNLSLPEARDDYFAQVFDIRKLPGSR